MKMKLLKAKSKLIAVVASVSLLFAASSQAKQPSLEESISSAIAMQSQLLMSQAAEQLQSSINEQISKLSIVEVLQPLTNSNTLTLVNEQDDVSKKSENTADEE
jgi:hypothetical protein